MLEMAGFVPNIGLRKTLGLVSRVSHASPAGTKLVREGIEVAKTIRLKLSWQYYPMGKTIFTSKVEVNNGIF